VVGAPVVTGVALPLSLGHLQVLLRLPLVFQALLTIASSERPLCLAHLALGLAQMIEGLLRHRTIAGFAALAELARALGEAVLGFARALEVTLRAGGRGAAKLLHRLLGPGELALHGLGRARCVATGALLWKEAAAHVAEALRLVQRLQ